MPSVTFLVALDLPEITPEALVLTAEEIHDDLEASHSVLSVVPWARPNNPVASPSGGFATLGDSPSPSAPTA